MTTYNFIYVDGLRGTLDLGSSLNNTDVTSTFTSAALAGDANNPGVPTLTGTQAVRINLYHYTSSGAVDNREAVYLVAPYTAGAGSGTIVRAQDGTAKQSWAQGATWDHGWTAEDIDNYSSQQQSGEYNILNFGALGDFNPSTNTGGASDQAAFVAAVAAAKIYGGEVVIPPSPLGSGYGYKLQTNTFTTIKPDIGIRGVGWPTIFAYDLGVSGYFLSQQMNDPHFWSGEFPGAWGYPNGTPSKTQAYPTPPPLTGLVIDGTFCTGVSTWGVQWGCMERGFLDLKIRNFFGATGGGVRWRNGLTAQVQTIGTAIQGSSTLIVANGTGLSNGMYVWDLSNPFALQDATTISGSGTTWTLSKNTNLALNSDSLCFGALSNAVWSEKCTFGPNMSILNCMTKVIMDGYIGTSSFGYTNFEQLHMNTLNPAERGLVIQNSFSRGSGSIVYSANMRIQGNNAEFSNNVLSYAGTPYGALTTALTAGTTYTSVGLTFAGTFNDGDCVQVNGGIFSYGEGEDFDAETDAVTAIQYMVVNGAQNNVTSLTVHPFVANFNYTTSSVVQVSSSASMGYTNAGTAAFIGTLSTNIAKGATAQTTIVVNNTGWNTTHVLALQDGWTLLLRNGIFQQMVVVDGAQTSPGAASWTITVRPFTASQNWLAAASGSDYVASLEVIPTAINIGTYGADKVRLQGVVDVVVEGFGSGLYVGTLAIVETFGNWNFGEWSWNESSEGGLFRHSGLINIPGIAVGIIGEIQGTNAWTSSFMTAGEAEINGALMVRPTIGGGNSSPPADQPGAVITSDGNNNVLIRQNPNFSGGSSTLAGAGDDLAFYGVTPVARQASGGITTVAQVVTALKNLGLLS